MLTKVNKNDKSLNDQIDNHFSDPKRKKLIKALDAVLNKASSTKKGKFGVNIRWYAPIAASVVLLIFFLVFKLNYSDKNNDVPIETVQNKSKIESKYTQNKGLSKKEPIRNKESDNNILDKSRKAYKTQNDPESKYFDKEVLYAQIDPARYKTNSEMEVLTKSYLRGGKFEIKIEKNILPIYYLPINSHKLSLKLSAIIEGEVNPSLDSFHLIIFNNIDNINPVLEIPFIIHQDESETIRMFLNKKISLDFGLYYYFIESSSGDIIKGGQFKIQPTD